MKKILAVLLVLCLSVMLFACGRTEGEDVTVRVVTLQGPTGMGMVQLMTSDEAGTSANDYEFTLASSPEEAQAAIANVDIAALPVNLAAALYNRGEDISFAAINTLGVLSILENGNTIESIEDLRGKTIYATGQGSTPEYILNYLLEKNGIDPETDVTIEYLTEHTELATRLASGDAAIGLLPEPNVTVALTSAAANGNTDLRIALDVTEEWAKLGEGELVQGCIVVSNEFKTEHPEQFEAFMEEYKASVRKRLEEAAENRAERAFENEVIEKLTEMAEVEIPEPMVEDEITSMLRDMEQRMMYQGMRLEDFLKYTGQTLEQMREMYREQAQERVHTRLALEALKKAEGIEATEADIDAELQKVADAQNKPLDEIKEKLSDDVKEYYKLVAEMNKTLDALKGYAVASAPEAPKAAETDGE